MMPPSRGENVPSGRCPFRPASSSTAATHEGSTTPSLTPTSANAAGESSPGYLLASIVTTGGKGEQGEARTVGEARGKTLLLGELSLHRFPKNLVYKMSVNGEHLPPKPVPKWTVWLELPVGDSIALEVFARESTPGHDQAAFATVGRKVFQPLDFFTVSEVDFAAARVHFPWVERGAPDLTAAVEMRLEANAGHQVGLFGRGNVSTRCCNVRQKVKVLDRQDSSKRGSVLFGEDAETTASPLTDVEVVIIKDSYNKMLAWADVVMEFIVERLYFLVPALPDVLGGLAPNLQRYLHGVIDLAVRSLDPATENVSRESYGALHPDDARPHQDVRGYSKTMAEQGFLLTHWEVVRDLWMDAMRRSPYMEAYELANMDLGTESAAYRFFELHVLKPMAEAIADMEGFYQDETNAQLVRESWKPYKDSANLKWALGVEFYARLFSQHPDLVPFFRGAQMDVLSKHLGQALELVATSFGDMWEAMPTLRHLGEVHADLGIPSSAHDKITEVLMQVLRDKVQGFAGEDDAARRLRDLWSKAWNRTTVQVRLPMENAERLVSKAYEWVDQAAHELQWDDAYTSTRKGHIYNEVINCGTYSHTPEELVHGARVCWRNSAKCIGRIAWNTLVVRDKRHVTDLAEMFAECMEHQRLAMADGSIKSVMTVFRPKAPGERMGTRFWNSQLTRYAAYTLEDGSVIGDRANLELTKAIIGNGWVPPSPKGPFDLLPIVFESPDKEIRMFDIPPGYAREVRLEHPNHPEFAKLGLKWGAVPSITNFTMSLGGIDYTACPFNGWFMNTEVARDLIEEGRCARAHEIAASFGIKVSDTDPFWKDRTFLELNYAIMHSFRKDGASIVDHHTASQQFMTHDLREKRVGRECPAQWSWIVPPLGGSLTSVFHHEMRHFDKDPRFVYQAEIFHVKRSRHAPVSAGEEGAPAVAAAAQKKRVLVLYGSETGTAEAYAYETASKLRSFCCHVSTLDEMDPSDLTASDVHAVLVVTSTFGDGGMPQGAKDFYDKVKALRPAALSGVRYSVMALGSSAYPDYCQAGKDMDQAFARLGAKALVKIQLGNELDGQLQSVREWQGLLEPVLGVGPQQVQGADASGGRADTAAGARVVYLDANSDEVQHAQSNPWEFVRKGFSLAAVTKNQELLRPATNDRSTRFVEVDLSESPDLSYETGDHVSVLPSNSPILVADTLKRIGADHSRWFTVEGNTRPPFPMPTSVARAFVHELDLCTRAPVSGLLELLLKRSSDDQDKRRLEALLEEQEQPSLWAKTETKLLNTHTTVLAVLKEFPSAAVTVEDLVLTLPLVKPRHYSISSAAEVDPRRLQLTVGVLKVRNEEEGTTREGLCSHHLSRITPGELLRVTVRPSSFRAPRDLTASPVIMVGPGTGISPIMGFLQAREKAMRQNRQRPLKPCLVYFGCRDSSEKLYSEQMHRWLDSGVITGLHVAMSRGEGPKTYVQHLISRQHAEVWELLRDPNCHVYVCGDSSMGEEVKAELMMATLRRSPMDRFAVVEFFEDMKREGRLQSDTWGVGLHGSDGQGAFISNQKGQGRWRSQVKSAAQQAAAPALVTPLGQSLLTHAPPPAAQERQPALTRAQSNASGTSSTNVGSSSGTVRGYLGSVARALRVNLRGGGGDDDDGGGGAGRRGHAEQGFGGGVAAAAAAGGDNGRGSGANFVVRDSGVTVSRPLSLTSARKGAGHWGSSGGGGGGGGGNGVYGGYGGDGTSRIGSRITTGPPSPIATSSRGNSIATTATSRGNSIITTTATGNGTAGGGGGGGGGSGKLVGKKKHRRANSSGAAATEGAVPAVTTPGKIKAAFRKTLFSRRASFDANDDATIGGSGGGGGSRRAGRGGGGLEGLGSPAAGAGIGAAGVGTALAFSDSSRAEGGGLVLAAAPCGGAGRAANGSE
eukprot:g4883.t1